MFAYPYCPIYYFLTETTNPTRFSFLMYGYNTPSQMDEVKRVLEAHRVKYVVWNSSFETDGVNSFFPGSKLVRPEDLVIEPYLESHYKVVWVDGGTRVMERNQ